MDIIEHYQHNNQKYVRGFPTSLFPLRCRSGPQKCHNCYYYGTIDDIFIGFCLNCATYVYDSEFGEGMHFDPSYENSDINFPNYIEDEQRNQIMAVATIKIREHNMKYSKCMDLDEPEPELVTPDQDVGLKSHQEELEDESQIEQEETISIDNTPINPSTENNTNTEESYETSPDNGEVSASYYQTLMSYINKIW